MKADTSAPGSGRRGLGPHVVGSRVVVRRVLRGEVGPSGGPAMTDVLGVCTSWGDGALTVRPASGPEVTIALADVVSGKTVPPPPSRRRRVSPLAAQRHALAMWPQVQTEPLGDWMLRSDPRPVGRPLKRANSCLAMGDPGVPLEVGVRRTLAFYDRRGRPALAQVESGSTVERAFAGAGWRTVPGADSLFLIASLDDALSRARGDARGRGDSPGHERTGVALEADGPRARAWVADRAEARAACDSDWLGLHAVTVDPTRRRLGLATRLMVALLEWGDAQGASTAWLQVEADNSAARTLYTRLGFAVHHHYRYLAAPGEPGT